MKISVIGAGTMGNGIAHVFAQNGFEVLLIDINKESLDRAIQTITKNLDRQLKKEKIDVETKRQTLNRISVSSELFACQDCDVIIEAATENEAIKKSIFKEIDSIAKASAILATNTSSISITDIASVTNRPDKIIGWHFMNPVPIMKLVEIIKAYSTSEETVHTVIELSERIQKIPVLVNDYPGFIANRILMPMLNEAIYSLYEGVAGVVEIDTIMKLGMAHPMGPLQLADYIGLDVCQAILQVLYKGLGNPKYAPCPLLNNMVSAGKLGRKSGEGFYDYSENSKELKVSRSFAHLR